MANHKNGKRMNPIPDWLVQFRRYAEDIPQYYIDHKHITWRGQTVVDMSRWDLRRAQIDAKAQINILKVIEKEEKSAGRMNKRVYLETRADLIRLYPIMECINFCDWMFDGSAQIQGRERSNAKRGRKNATRSKPESSNN